MFRSIKAPGKARARWLRPVGPGAGPGPGVSSHSRRQRQTRSGRRGKRKRFYNFANHASIFANFPPLGKFLGETVPDRLSG